MYPQHFLAVLKARNLEFLRDRSSWAWNVIFPVLLIVGLAFVFGDENRPVYKVAVYPVAESSHPFLQLDHIQFVEVSDIDEAVQRVERHQFDLLLDVESNRYWINDTSPKGYFVERALLGSYADSEGTADTNRQSEDFERQPVTGKAVRYVDWVVPGVLGMNMMFSCLFGVGYVIVRYRKSGVLKRLKATPLRPVEFLAAQVVSRLWLVLAITVVVFGGSHLFLKFTMNGSYFSLLLVMTLGAVCLISLGLLLSVRTRSEELAGGLLNVATWPMMILSGVWFSMEGAHPWLKLLSSALPLTHIIDSARSIMIDGATLLDISGSLAFLTLATVLFLALGAWLFRWE
ncbi:MAG: ABC transporter permease [Gammaproteobacteria bacterium]|nr:ABC transporter permease [Gammaproteobacteria bacterium]